jgi:hypothetical protein
VFLDAATFEGIKERLSELGAVTPAGLDPEGGAKGARGGGGAGGACCGLW